MKKGPAAPPDTRKRRSSLPSSKGYQSKRRHACTECGYAAGRKERAVMHITKEVASGKHSPSASALPCKDSPPEPPCAQGGGELEETTDLGLPGGEDCDAPCASASAPDASDSMPDDRVDVLPARQNVDPGKRQNVAPVGRSDFEDYVIQTLQSIREAVHPDALARQPDPEELDDSADGLRKLATKYPALRIACLDTTDAAGGDQSIIAHCAVCRGPFGSKAKNSANGRLAYVVKRHMEGRNHLRKQGDVDRVAKERQIAARSNNKAQENIGRVFLHCVQEGDAMRRIEREIAILFACGSEVGDFRHSRMTLSPLLDGFCELVRAALGRHLQGVSERTDRKPVLSVACDKTTERRRTVLIISISSLVGGEITPFFANAVPVGVDLSGQHMVQLLKECVAEFCGEDGMERVASWPCDGELRYGKENLREGRVPRGRANGRRRGGQPWRLVAEKAGRKRGREIWGRGKSALSPPGSRGVKLVSTVSFG